MDYELVYEFESVVDKASKRSKLNDQMYANPVFIFALKVGRSALLGYIDKPDKSIITSTVQSILVIHNHIHIETLNTDYILKPHLRRVIK
ncbi:hypothetical protein JDW21_19440 [Bacillus subtilis]|uniref:hypothetical protein n=1 Tax=Bacillus subtilis TaxID=1423 RepID=UPI002ED0BB48